jgi:hypothetical protein
MFEGEGVLGVFVLLGKLLYIIYNKYI